MPVRVVKLPDVGEGIAEAELVEWHVAVGDQVTTETVLADVMTDKATVEVSAPVAGVITFLTGSPGDVLSVGADFVGIETDAGVGTQGDVAPSPAAAAAAAATVPASATAEATAGTTPPPSAEPRPAPARAPAPAPAAQTSRPAAAERPRPASRPPAPAARPIAAPAVRQRARELGVDLRLVRGSGPVGRITHADLDAHLAGPTPSRGAAAGGGATHEVRLIGLRRRIAERMQLAASRIPHITYVDEVDVTALEELRAALNREAAPAGDAAEHLTILPFVCRAVIRAVADQPQLNATFDDEAEVLTTHEAVHLGIATQTPNGLMVPVVRHAEALDPWACAREIARLSAAARAGTATRAELGGSTITITSLGALGGLVTTPIINHPEVAIVGVNKLQVRPVWDGNGVRPRTMMNLSCSFDHRIVDGWDAATFVQRVKSLLETPALLFVEPPRAGATA